MRTHERIKGVLRAPQLTWNILARGRYPFVYDQMPFCMHGMSWRKRLNLFKSGGNFLYRRLQPWAMPLHMQFELTNYCNLQCPVCPAGIGAVGREKQAMDVDFFERIIDEVGPYLLTASLWAWGEPLLHPQLKDILQVSRKYPFIKLLSTNGQFLNRDSVIEALIHEPPTVLIVAIDGLTDETNTKFRSGARLEPVLNGVKELAELKREYNQQLPVLHMRFIVMKHNQHQVPELEQFARDHHFDLLSLRTLSIIDTESPDAAHQCLVPDDEELRAYHYRNGQRLQRDDFICLEPFWFPTVFADGTLVACEQDYNARLSMGQINDTTSFSDLWFSDHAKSIRRQIRDRGGEVSFCRNCPYRDRGTTDCSIAAHLLNPDIDCHHLV